MEWRRFNMDNLVFFFFWFLKIQSHLSIYMDWWRCCACWMNTHYETQVKTKDKVFACSILFWKSKALPEGRRRRRMPHLWFSRRKHGKKFVSLLVIFLKRPLAVKKTLTRMRLTSGPQDCLQKNSGAKFKEWRETGMWYAKKTRILISFNVFFQVDNDKVRSPVQGIKGDSKGDNRRIGPAMLDTTWRFGFSHEVYHLVLQWRDVHAKALLSAHWLKSTSSIVLYIH